MITYKELRNFQRLERENNDFQELGEAFVSNVLQYLNEKREALKSSKEKDSIFSKDAQNEIRNELRNAIVVIQDIYERRERKILGQAVLAVKTDSSIQDTTKMLDFEKQMYTEMIELLRRYRNKFFGQRKEKAKEETQPVETPSTSLEKEEIPPEKHESTPVQPEPPQPEAPPTPLEKKIPTELQEQTLPQPEKQEISPVQPEPELLTIKITQDVPQFIWEDGKTYGPFKEEDVANLSEKLASMLVSRGSAEIL
jgi:DNA replication initiation complex subunit (GINS family)